MSGFLTSSIGRKFVMSISGLFLMLFLLVHLSVNLLLLAGSNAFNTGAHFMATNPMVQIMQPLLGIGFLVHIVYSFILTMHNRSARGSEQYALKSNSHNSTWASRSMLFLGGMVLAFLIIHISDFFWKMKFGEMPHVMVKGVQMEDAYTMVATRFQTGIVYDIIYIVGSLFLGLHLYHGFWSAFQTQGLSNNLWRSRLQSAGMVYACVMGIGFAMIPLYFLIFQPCATCQ